MDMTEQSAELKALYNCTKLPLYLRLAELKESTKIGSLVCVLQSEKHQTKEYNLKKFYKPILISHVEI